MNAFRKLLKDWVIKILMRERDCLSRKSGKLMIAKVRKKHFGKRDDLAYATLQNLAHGIPGDGESIMAFANALRLNPVDRSELLIRWGEVFINRYAYQLSDQRLKAFIRGWREIPYETVHELQIDPILNLISPSAGVACGITVYLQSRKQSLASIKGVPYSTMARFSAKGLASPKVLNKFLNEVKPPNLAPNSSSADIVRFQQQILTLEKICADYVEAQLRCRRLLNLQQTDLRKRFDPSIHSRLAAWLVRACLPVLHGSVRVEPLYFP